MEDASVMAMLVPVRKRTSLNECVNASITHVEITAIDAVSLTCRRSGALLLTVLITLVNVSKPVVTGTYRNIVVVSVCFIYMMARNLIIFIQLLLQRYLHIWYFQ